MSLTQHQKFLSAYKKYYSLCYITTPYSTFYNQSFNTSNFILKSFKYSIKRSKIQKIYYPFRGFLFLNSLKIRNIVLPSKPINKIYSSLYFKRNLTCILDKKGYQTIKNSQFKRQWPEPFFCKQVFSCKDLPFKNMRVDYQIMNLFVYKHVSRQAVGHKKLMITCAFNAPFYKPIGQLQFAKITYIFSNQPIFRWKRVFFSSRLPSKPVLKVAQPCFFHFNGKGMCLFPWSVRTRIKRVPVFRPLFLKEVAIGSLLSKKEGAKRKKRKKIFNRDSVNTKQAFRFLLYSLPLCDNTWLVGKKNQESTFRTSQKWNFKLRIVLQNFIFPINKAPNSILTKRQKFIRKSLKGILLVNFPEKEKNFLTKNLAAENKIALITQSASLLLKDSRNMDDLLGVDDPIQILFDKVKTCIPCICFINNLDRIGKQRYEHTSLREQKFLNNSISVLIDPSNTDHRIFKTSHEEKKLDSSTTALANKVSTFDQNSKEKLILKNFQVFRFKNTQNSNQRLFQYLSPFLFLKDIASGPLLFLKEEEAKNKGQLKGPLTTSFKNMSLNINTSVFLNNPLPAETDAKDKLLMSLPSGQEFRLPFWLFKNSFFPVYKIGLSRVKLFYSFYNLKKEKENLLRTNSLKASLLKPLSYIKTGTRFSLVLKDPRKTLNLLPNSKTLTQILSKTNSIFEKPESKLINAKTNLKNSQTIYNQDLLKTALTESDSTKILSCLRPFHKLKPISKINRDYVAPPKKKQFGHYFGFKEPLFKEYQYSEGDLGKIPIEKEKISRIYVDSNQQSIGFGTSLLWNLPRCPYFEKTDMSVLKSRPINTTFQGPTSSKFIPNLERERNKNNSLKISETDIIKRTALLKFLQILDGFHTTTGIKKSIFFPYFKLLKKFNMSKIVSILPKKIKPKSFRSSLLKQFSSPLFVPSSFLPLLFLKAPSSFKRRRGKKEDARLRPLLEIKRGKENKWQKTGMPFSLVLKEQGKRHMPFKLKFKGYRRATFKTGFEGSVGLKIYDKHDLFIRNFLTPLIFQERLIKHNSARTLNLIQNNIWFSKINRFKKPAARPLKKTKKSSIHSSTVMLYQPKDKFLGYDRLGLSLHPMRRDEVTPNSKKTIQLPSFNFLWLNELVSKGEIYLKNQPSLKSLNLLCVWPSYIEDRLGPFNMNDGASYLLPEYFQLLGHGPKLKKQGITLIASTNNLTTLDAALLRPGRFDTIINFSHSFSSMAKYEKMLKHSPSFTQNNRFSLFKSSIKEKKLVDNLVWPYNLDQDLIVRKKENSLLFLEKNTNFLFNKSFLISSISSINLLFKIIKNQFYPQVMVLDIPNQSIPIKTFIDVSFFIQYKLWWSFNNGKLLWFGLYKTGLIQKPKISVLNSENFKLFKPTTYNVVLILKSKINKAFLLKPFSYIKTGIGFFLVLKDFIYIFIGSIRMISFRFFSNIFQLSQRQVFKNKLLFPKDSIESVSMQDLHTNKTKLTTETSINQNFDLFNALGREVLISKASFWGLPKNLHSLNSFFNQYHVPKKIAQVLPNYENTQRRWPPNFRGNFQMENNNMFLKSSRNLLFCTGDFGTQTYSEKDADMILIKKPWKEKKKNLWPTYKNQTKNTRCATPEKKKASHDTLNRNPFLKSEFYGFTKSIDVSTAFFDQSSKSWKDNKGAIFVKNINRNNDMLTKYNKIYKLKKIKLKQLSFFNLHPFTSSMLKRWSEVTKPNKIKQHLKFSLINIGLSRKNQSYNDFRNGNLFSIDNQLLKDYSDACLLPSNHISLLEKESFKTNDFVSMYESYLFKKLSTNSSLNIRCLQIDFTLLDLKKRINRKFFNDNFFLSCTNLISNRHLLQTRNILKKIPRRILVNNDTYNNFQITCKFKCFNDKTNKLEMNNNNMILLKNSNFVLNEKKEHNNIIKTRESFLQTPPVISKGHKALKAKPWGETQNSKMCQLDISFFLLIFYTMFFEKIQQKKIKLNTIKIFMPYKSMIFSHFLLSQSEIYSFSCKNFEILIYNKFQNFFLDL